MTTGLAPAYFCTYCQEPLDWHRPYRIMPGRTRGAPDTAAHWVCIDAERKAEEARGLHTALCHLRDCDWQPPATTPHAAGAPDALCRPGRYNEGVRGLEGLTHLGDF